MRLRDLDAGKEEIYAMWERNFHDPVPYADFYFAQVYGKNTVLIKEDDGVLQGMIHLNPYTLRVAGVPVAAHYIVGVATDEEYRRRGVMRELLGEALARMRDGGEPLTYLMPADERYYLPFGFRFGMDRYEQEVEFLPEPVRTAPAEGWTFRGAGSPDYGEISSLENASADEIYAIHTEISEDYLKRLEKEVAADFGKIFYIYDEGKYQGRVVLNAENGYLILSQVVCIHRETGGEFLRQLLAYCENTYHYGRYQWSLDESFAPLIREAGTCGVLRTHGKKRRPTIMMRILDVAGLAPFLRGRGEGRIRLHIADDFVREQAGAYLWETTRTGSRIVPLLEGETPENVPDGGSLCIEALTECIFAAEAEERSAVLASCADLTREGKEFLAQLEGLRYNGILEIV